MGYAATVKKLRWRDLSEEHRVVREELEKYIGAAIEGEEYEKGPITIIGPYGSGKSELMRWGFKKAWERGIPALYVSLGTLVKGIQERVSVVDLPSILSGLISSQRSKIANHLDDDKPPAAELWLPDLEEESLGQYFREVGFDPGEIRRSLQDCAKTVLFIDEMEQAYQQLLSKIEVSDRAPLREVLDQHHKERFYPVMGFALVSAYEMLGAVEEGKGAEERRFYRLTLPIPERQHFAGLVEFGTFCNFMWWASRGRPGWAWTLWDRWQPHVHQWQHRHLEDLAFYLSEDIDSVPALNWSCTSNVFGSAREVIKHLLFQCCPVITTSLPNESLERALSDLAQRHLIFVSSDLLPIEIVVGAMVEDLSALYQGEFKGIGELHGNVARRYLRRILEATGSDSKIAFGGWRFGGEAFSTACVAPLLALMHDLILEFEGETEGGKALVDFLHHLGAVVGIWEHRIDTGKMVTSFPKTRGLFQDVYSLDKAVHTQPSFSLIEQLFPSQVVSPLVRLFPDAKSNIKSQREHLEGALFGKAPFPHMTYAVQDLEVDFIPLPSASLVSKLQETSLSLTHKDYYLPFKRVIAILDCAEETSSIALDPSQNAQLEVLEKHLSKIQFYRLEERRLRDFVTSISHNFSLEGDSESFDLADRLDTLLQSPERLDKHVQRSLRYFRNLLLERMSRFASAAAKQYKTSMESAFSKRDLPESQIREAQSRIRDYRAIDSILCALDASRDQARVTNILSTLRTFDKLEELTREGYGEFFRRYGATTRGQLTTYQEAIARYFMLHGGFNDVLTLILPALPYQPEHEAWQTMSLAEDVARRDTLLDILFGDYAGDTGKLVLKALDISYCLLARKGNFKKRIEELKSNLAATRDGFVALIQEVEDFNQKVKSISAIGNLLSTDNLQKLQNQLEKAEQLLRGDEPQPWGTLHVAYRFLTEAQGRAEDHRQLCHSDASVGLAGWRLKLRDILNLEVTLGSFKEELTKEFATNASLKTDLFGDLDTVYVEKVEGPLKEAALEVLNQLTPPYALGENVPDIDYRPFTEVYEKVRKELDDLQIKMHAADEIIANYSLIREVIRNIDQTLRGGSK